jgi:hypothetical protein
MLVENLNVTRVILHEVHQRKDSPNIIEPTYGKALENLSAKAMSHFSMRITDALSAQSRSMEMVVFKTSDSDVIGSVRRMSVGDVPVFIGESQKIAHALADAQRSRAIPGGMVLVFDGTVGANDRPFVGIIKAELQSGFRRQTTAEKVVTEFLDAIFLTPATRLYKLGIYVSDDRIPDAETKWSCHVFDSNITATRREDAAHYFYSGFLGCQFPENGRYETPKFFDLTKEYLKQSPVDADLKRDISDALYTYIKVDQSPTFTTQNFAESFLPIELRDSYNSFMQSKKFPTDRAVHKDVTDMGSRLRRRKFRFGGDADFSATPEALRSGTVVISKLEPSELVDSASIEREVSWTQITIKRPITEQL